MTDPDRPTCDPDAAKVQRTIIYRLRLYISGATPRSLQAVRNIKMIGELNLAGLYELEVIDVYRKIRLARDEDIIALPTLIKHFPPPERRIIGSLSDIPLVLRGLGL
jgi:circadian clock protein KaiB